MKRNLIGLVLVVGLTGLTPVMAMSNSESRHQAVSGSPILEHRGMSDEVAPRHRDMSDPELRRQFKIDHELRRQAVQASEKIKHHNAQERQQGLQKRFEKGFEGHRFEDRKGLGEFGHRDKALLDERLAAREEKICAFLDSLTDEQLDLLQEITEYLDGLMVSNMRRAHHDKESQGTGVYPALRGLVEDVEKDPEAVAERELRCKIQCFEKFNSGVLRLERGSLGDGFEDLKVMINEFMESLTEDQKVLYNLE